jgi:hypothetical protein
MLKNEEFRVTDGAGVLQGIIPQFNTNRRFIRLQTIHCLFWLMNIHYTRTTRGQVSFCSFPGLNERLLIGGTQRAYIC